jgi:hypothetical protein
MGSLIEEPVALSERSRGTEAMNTVISSRPHLPSTFVSTG